MEHIYNSKNELSKRRKLRNNMTEAEVILWSKLKNKQVNGHRFRRQYSVGKYIVDFYCAKLKLAIEVDGDLHYVSERTKKYDIYRQKQIELFRIKFLRFTNVEIYKNLEGVLRTIEIIATSKNPSPAGSGTSPLKGEGIIS